MSVGRLAAILGSLFFVAFGLACLWATIHYEHVAPAVPVVGLVWSVMGIISAGFFAMANADWIRTLRRIKP